MQLGQPLPGDVLEIVVVSVPGSNPPGTVTSLVGFSFSHATAGTFYPIATSVVADASGSSRITATGIRFGLAANAVLVSDTVTVLLNGVSIGTSGLASVQLSPAGDFARQLAQIIGPAYQPADGTRTAEDLRALGRAVYLGRATNLSSVGEAFADTATQLLAELEAEYGLSAGTSLTTAQRQTRLLAKLRAKFAGTVSDILSAIRSIEPLATITEWTVATINGAGSVALRYVFRFTVLVPLATYSNTYLKALLAATLEQMKPAHTTYAIGVNLGFKCDDAGSLCDQDILTQ